MKTFELFEDTGGKLLSGGLAHWRKKLGVTRDDIKQAMEKARQLDSYQRLIKYAPENTTKRQKAFGTISFDASIKGASSFTNTYVHFYGQVRSGNDDRSRNAPLVSKEPQIIPGDPVQTVLNAYDNGFKTILKSINIMRRRNAPELARKDVIDILRDAGISDVKVGTVAKEEIDFSDPNWWRARDTDRKKIKRGKPGVLVVPSEAYKVYDELYSRKQKPEEFLADITDDPKIREKLLSRLNKKSKEEWLDGLSASDRNMRAVADVLRNQTKFDLDVRLMKMSDVKSEFKVNTSWPDEFAEAFLVVYARLKNEGELNRYRYAELDDV